MLLALHILLDTLAPAENAPAVRLLLNAITGDPVMCILLAAALTWAAHSSVATVLLIMSLAYSQFMTPAAALALVLGANLGSAINPVFEGGRRGDPASYRLPVGNLINRLVGVVLVAPFLPALAGAFLAFQPDLAKMTAEFHIAFNVVLAIAFIGLLDPLAWLLERIFPERKKSADPAAPRYLDESALETPSLALADAARETLRMGDIVEVMLRQVMTALMTNDRALAREVSRMDNAVDKLDEAIKLYVTKLTRGSLDEREGAPRHGDHLVRDQPRAHRRHHRQEPVRARGQEDQAQAAVLREGAAELAAFHKRILESLSIAFGVFMSGDVERGAQADRREDRAAQRRARGGRAALRAVARGAAGDAGDDLAASRRAARPQAHPLAHLLGRLSGAGGGRRDRRGGRRRKRSDHARRTRRQAGSAVDVGRLRPSFPPLPFTGAAPHNRNLCVKKT